MAFITEEVTWAAAIYEIATGDKVLGGPTGPNNLAAQALAARTQFLLRLARGRLQVQVTNSQNVVLTADQAAHAIIEVTGALAEPVGLVMPSAAAVWIVRNATTGGQRINVRTAGRNSVPVLPGGAWLLYCDGVDIIDALSAGAGTALPQMDGAASAGTSTRWAREDHRHPPDTSRADAQHTHAIAAVIGLQVALDGKSDTGHTHGIGSVTGLQVALNGKSDTGHTHGIGSVTGLQGALNGKSDTGHTHGIDQVGNLREILENKAQLDHTHAIAAVTGLQGALNGKSDTGHTHGIAGVTGLQGELNAKLGVYAPAVNGCRARVNWNGEGVVSIRSAYNVSSITDHGTGHYTVNFATPMPDADYSAVGSARMGWGNGDDGYLGPTRGGTYSVYGVEFNHGISGGYYPQDPVICNVVVF